MCKCCTIINATDTYLFPVLLKVPQWHQFHVAPANTAFLELFWIQGAL